MPIYEIPEDDLVGEVMIPAMAAASEARIAAGFFTSQCFAQIAPGLAAFLTKDSAPLRLLISPSIDPADREAMERGTKDPQGVIKDVVERLLADARLSDYALVHHTLDCLSYLVATKRLHIRFALMKEGMYHKKQWLMRDGADWLAVHGSGNATTRGLLVNGEQMTVDRPWRDGDTARARVDKLVRGWDRQWNNESPHVLCVELADGLKLSSGRRARDEIPTIDDFWQAWQADHLRGLEPPLPPGVLLSPPKHLAIPDGLEWRTGDYRHQGAAVDKFVENGSRGILAIATGGGKTQTALVAAVQEQNRHQGPMLVLVVVPSAPLVRQWADAVRRFGVEPFLPSDVAGPKRRARIEEVKAALAAEHLSTAVIVCTQQLLTTDSAVRELVDSLPASVLTMIIGDEAHNLGAPRFIEDPPRRFDVRLGLSATPTRQYDPAGTTALIDYFGPEVYEFTIQDAIKAGCLTPYNYHLHEVSMSNNEMAEYAELTRQLGRKGFSGADNGNDAGLDSQVESLLRRRRALLEQVESKIPRLVELLREEGVRNIEKTLVYTSAKPSALGGARQIDEVNAALRDLGLAFHEFTSEQTSKSKPQRYLEAFGRGEYQVLTAMKVLDEGIDIPQTDAAYLLASSTVRREWVQRRGRILRKSEGKQIADLHDFLVVPPDPASKAGRAVLRGELERAREFASVADNEFDTDGPRTVISRYDRMF